MKPTKKLYQWDVNQSLAECKGSYVDFFVGTDTYRVEIQNGECLIPDEFLQTSGLKTVYDVYADGTYYAQNLEVIGRPQPPDYIFTPTERTTFDSLVERVDNAVADMYAKAEAGEFDGADGVDGADGFSPTATVERTTDGAVITITDKDGTTTAEVYDGVSKEYVDGQIEVVQGEIEATADKLDVLWKLSKGIIYDWQTADTDGTVTVPSGAKSSVLQGLKGKSIVEDGELKSASVTKFTINGTDYPIVFSGKSAGTVRDEIDLVNKKYIQRVGVVDLGTLNWLNEEFSGYSIFRTSGVTDAKRHAVGAMYENQINSNGYTSVTTISTSMADMSIIVNSNATASNRIYIRDNRYTTPAEFKTAMNGVMLYYELANPIETEITQEEITAITASGDTIVFDGDIEVGSVFSHFIALNEVNV